jgi:carboxysome shell carbonic anhydrase
MAVNTLKRINAMRAVESLRQPQDLDNPACVISAHQRCEHALVDQALNERLFAYERQIRSRFTPIVDLLKTLSGLQHELDFVSRAQQLAQSQLGYHLPEDLLSRAWIGGLDLRALHAHCIFASFKLCVDAAAADQAPWIERMAIDEGFLQACGFHTLDISPCADGRLQGLLPFVFRIAPSPAVVVKAYAGALFDVEGDVNDWTRREIERLSGHLEGAPDGNYLKMAVYHYSTSHPCLQGCAAHGSQDDRATVAANDKLNELRSAIDNTFGRGAAPETLLIGMDTDTDAIRVHLPDELSANCPLRYVDSAQIFKATLGLNQHSARDAIAHAVSAAEPKCGIRPGMRRLIERLLEANLSQIEYVIQHHEGRYADIGHNERFICAGEALSELQLRNKFYFAHLDTVEEGTADLDVGIKIFTGLNVSRGLPIPVLCTFSIALVFQVLVSEPSAVVSASSPRLNRVTHP